MNTRKYFYMGLGAIVALALGASAFAFTGSTQASADDRFVAAQFADDGFGANLDGGFDDAEHPGRPGHGGKRGGQRDNSALLEELGVTQEQWDTAKEAVRASLEGSEDRPDKETVQALFAAELGITVEEIEAAKDAVKEAKLAEALANGDITQEEIDLMEARKAVAETIDQKAVMAGILGLTVEELDAAKEAGTIRDLIEESGLTQEEIKEQAEAAFSAAVDQAAADGLITTEQAEQIKEAGFGKGRGGHGKGGKRGGRGNGNGDRGIGNGNGANDA